VRAAAGVRLPGHSFCCAGQQAIDAASTFFIFPGIAGRNETTVISNPTDIPDCILWLRSDQGLFKDVGKTLPVSADGDGIGCWADQSGAGNDCSQTSALNQPKYDQQLDLVHFEVGNHTDASGNEYLNLPADLNVNAQSFSFFTVAELVTTRADFIAPNIVPAFQFQLEIAGSTSLLYDSSDGILDLFDGAFKDGAKVPPTSRSLLGFIAGSSNAQIIINGNTQPVAALTAETAGGGAIFGSNASANPCQAAGAIRRSAQRPHGGAWRGPIGSLEDVHARSRAVRPAPHAVQSKAAGGRPSLECRCDQADTKQAARRPESNRTDLRRTGPAIRVAHAILRRSRFPTLGRSKPHPKARQRPSESAFARVCQLAQSKKEPRNESRGSKIAPYRVTKRGWVRGRSRGQDQVRASPSNERRREASFGYSAAMYCSTIHATIPDRLRC